jgi:hypothetical protein
MIDSVLSAFDLRIAIRLLLGAHALELFGWEKERSMLIRNTRRPMLGVLALCLMIVAACQSTTSADLPARPLSTAANPATPTITGSGGAAGLLAKADSNQLSGTWRLKHDNVPEPYTTVLVVEEGRITGYTLFGDQKFSLVGAVYADGRVAFTVGQTNDHSGKLLEGSRIEGAWINKSGRTGTFVMTRAE